MLGNTGKTWSLKKDKVESVESIIYFLRQNDSTFGPNDVMFRWKWHYVVSRCHMVRLSQTSIVLGNAVIKLSLKGENGIACSKNGIWLSQNGIMSGPVDINLNIFGIISSQFGIVYGQKAIWLCEGGILFGKD